MLGSTNDRYLEMIPTMNISLSHYQHELASKNKREIAKRFWDSIDNGLNKQNVDNPTDWKRNLHMSTSVDLEIIHAHEASNSNSNRNSNSNIPPVQIVNNVLYSSFKVTEIFKENTFDIVETNKCKCKQDKSHLMIVINPGITIRSEEKPDMKEIQSIGNFEIQRICKPDMKEIQSIGNFEIQRICKPDIKEIQTFWNFEIQRICKPDIKEIQTFWNFEIQRICKPDIKEIQSIGNFEIPKICKPDIKEIQSIENLEIPRSYISCKAEHVRKFKNIEMRAKRNIQKNKIAIESRDTISIIPDVVQANTKIHDSQEQPAAEVQNNSELSNMRYIKNHPSFEANADGNINNSKYTNPSEQLANLSICQKMINKQNMLLKYLPNIENILDYYPNYQPPNLKPEVGIQISEIESLYETIKADLIELKPLLQENPRMKEQLFINISQGNEEKFLFFTNLYKLINNEKIEGNFEYPQSFTNGGWRRNKANDINCSQIHRNNSYHNFKPYINTSPNVKRYIPTGNNFPSVKFVKDLKNSSFIKAHRSELNKSYTNIFPERKVIVTFCQNKIISCEKNPLKLIDTRYTPKLNISNFK